jgi:DNA adenine methylase
MAPLSSIFEADAVVAQTPCDGGRRAQLNGAEPCRTAKPFLKWVGGKGRLLHSLVPLMPAGVAHMRHVEPFMGGAALYFHSRAERALLRDINPDLVQAFVTVRDDVQAVIEHLRELADGHDDRRYYEARERFNERPCATSAERAALFIYLNKTCFNGLYRVNRSGFFNVPVGRYARPAIADAETLLAASLRLRKADIRCAPFEDVLEDATRGDFVYLDPPYEPVSRTSSFTAYAQGGFTRSDQMHLRDVYRGLDRRGCKVMLSNSDAPLVRELYGAFHIHEVRAPRAVSCDPAKRGAVTELVIRNY